MKKQKIVCLWIGIMLLSWIGCATELDKNYVTPTAIIEQEMELSVSPAIGKEEVNIFQKKEDLVTPTPSSKQMVTKTEGLCEILEKTEESFVGYNSLNQMLSNNSSMGFCGTSYFCVDESTGISYFVNQGKDYFLYRIKEGEVDLAVAMPVKEINIYQDAIYFMVDSYEQYELQGIKNGDIYCYTPANGSVELVYALGEVEGSKNHKLTVEESGIYFSYEIVNETESTISFWHLPFGETEPIKDRQFITMKGWNNYFFNIKSSNLVLQSRMIEEDGTREIVELPPVRTACFCVIGDLLYSTNNTSVFCMNLETKEQVLYDFLEVIEKKEGKDLVTSGFQVIYSFTVTEEAIWVTTGTCLYRMDLQSGEVRSATIRNEKKFCNITTLYTNGKEVYGLDTPNLFSKEGIRVVRILTEDMDSSINCKIGVEFLTE